MKLTETELLNLSMWYREKADAVAQDAKVPVSAHELRLLALAAGEVLTLRAALKPAIELAEGLEAHFRENPESEWAMVTREEAEDLRRAAAVMKGTE